MLEQVGREHHVDRPVGLLEVQGAPDAERDIGEVPPGVGDVLRVQVDARVVEERREAVVGERSVVVGRATGELQDPQRPGAARGEERTPAIAVLGLALGDHLADPANLGETRSLKKALTFVLVRLASSRKPR